MKVAFIDDEPELFPNTYGGKARTIINYAMSLKKRGHEITIFSRTIRSEKNRFFYKGIQFIKLTDKNTINSIVKAQKTFDIVNFHTCSFTPLILKHRKGVVVYHLHDVYITTADKGSHLDKALALNWDCVISPSKFATDRFKKYNYNSTPIYTINRWVDQTRFSEVTDSRMSEFYIKYPKIEEFVKRYEQIVFWPSRNITEKGAYFVQQIINEKSSIGFIIADSYPQKENVLSLNWLKGEEMKYIYSIADLVISPSLLEESFSQVIIESIACKTPVVCFKFGNQQELGKEFRNVHVCDKKYSQIKCRIETVLEKNKKFSDDLIKIKTKYNENILTNEYLKIMYNLVRKSKSVNRKTKEKYNNKTSLKKREK